ncbi:ABC transporter permease [Campylobacter sp. MIT 97-5078]|uniref:ABC transporter permease n=1 Tax=Campylobacter sp. MIT 97-5078 TaxID=1548153 RepID=UPI000513CDC5|nr:ABC transporter permease [Campylobacter sp. MIT 97-5078]KGI56113.1 ABC transporter permease [Campylobacter sp. MIT 97-5078]KGI57106.1 ABC transporter permease [Campylobacter sp. MIT 97-5078]TQR25474.1 ABC transporter permease [Campylobacter sp. MIT 97-5078]
MLLKMIKNSIFKNKTQKILVFLSCFLASLLLASMLNITLSIGNELSKELRSYGANIIILPKGASLSVDIGDKVLEPLKDKSYLEESKLHTIKEIFWRNNITAFAPFLEGKVMMNDKQVSILGTYFDKKLNIADEDDFHTGIKELYPLLKIDGRYANDDSLDEVILGDEFASKNALNLNDELMLNDQKVKVVGIVHNFDKNANKIITSLALTQKLLHKEGLFFKAEVSALTIPENDLAQKARRLGANSLDSVEFDMWFCTAYVGSIAYQIEEDFQGASAKAQTAISDAENLIVTKIQTLMIATALISLIISSIAIASLMSSELHARKKEIGLLRVLGASVGQIYLIFAGENLCVGLIAAFFGFVFGVALSELIALNIFAYFIPIYFIILPLCVVFAGLAVLLACLLALRSISEQSEVQVLYGK